MSYKRGAPPPPAWLSKGAKEEYQRAVDLIDNLEQVDMAILCMYAQAYDDVARLTRQVHKEGETLVSDKGNAYGNPTCNALASAYKRMESSAKELGFSAAARKRIAMQISRKDEADPLADLR